MIQSTTVATAASRHSAANQPCSSTRAFSPQRGLCTNENFGSSFLGTDMDMTLHASTHTFTSAPVSAVAPDLSTLQGDGSFPEFGQHTYQSGMHDGGSADSQQYAMTQNSHVVQRASSADEYGDTGATTISTNVQSSTVEVAVYNHGMVTPGQSPANRNGFIDEQIVNKPISSAMWNTHLDFAPNSADVSATFPTHAGFAFEIGQQLLQPPPPHISSQSQPILSRQLPPRPQPPPRPLQKPSCRRQSKSIKRKPHRRKPRFKHFITSPFHDCIDSFGRNLPLRKITRPSDGKVSGYIKFSWPSKEGGRSSTTVEVASSYYNGDIPSSAAAAETASQRFERPLQRPCSVAPASASTPLAANDSPYPTSPTSALSQDETHVRSPKGIFQMSYPSDTTETPRLLPSHYGLDTLMDTKGRQLFNFYTRNWCPGRSILSETNPWFLFASMQQIPSVLAAMQSLAGIYVYDYTPNDTLRRRVNKSFAIAEARLSELLRNIRILDDNESSELITLASLLSMQDVVLTERRLQTPYLPRWLTGFRQAELVLQSMDDPAYHFYYKKSDFTQVSALYISQSVIVGRAVVLAQLMMPLPPLSTFNPVAETSRFGFLLYGSEADVYEIHGGCGFSRRLLHNFSQVNYCSTRMLQDAETTIVPVTAQMLYGQLIQLHQWSGEYDSWEAAKSRPQPIEWIRQTDENYVVQEAKEMTEVTAEAWRLGGMVYLQCRLFRLPRNHYMVINNIADLAKCISIMPTSGAVFTAQAPLLPVFFLGLLATVEEHVLVAEIWFQQVIKTPVRSSVPPLHRTLKRIQSWLDREVPVPAINVELPHAIAERQPWWEHMVSKVQEKENEVLCLT